MMVVEIQIMYSSSLITEDGNQEKLEKISKLLKQ